MASKQKKQERNLHILSDFVNMRFNLLNNKIYLSEKSKKNNTVAFEELPDRSSARSSLTKEDKAPRPKSLLKLQLYRRSQQQNAKEEQDGSLFQLKFLQKLCEDYLIIGNEYQLDMLRIGGVIEGFLDVEHKWSLGTKGVIHSISVQRKFSLIALCSKDKLWIYKYDLKKDHQLPKLVVNCSHSDQIKEVRFVKNAGIYIVMKSKLQYYKIIWICEKAQFIKKFTYDYIFNPNMSLFCVPAAWDHILNVYYCQQRNDQKFNLWMQSFVSLAKLQAPEVSKMVLIYTLEDQLKNRIQISNYNSEICIIQFQNKLIAFKNGFVIDAVSTNIHQPNYFIKYIPDNKTLFHFLENVIDIYSLNMIENTKPQKFKLMCLDCLQFKHKTKDKLFNILHLGKDRYAFFFQTQLSRSSSDTPNIIYRFAATSLIDVKTKLNYVYPSKQEMSKLSYQQLYEKSNIVLKMGLTKRQAFLQLWLRSSMSTIMDFQLLLSTKHFSTIQSEIEHKLKRHSMSMRQLLKIYGECFKMLQKRVYSDKCTLEYLKQYSSCHFLMKKMQMLRWIFSSKNTQQGTILINIKDYYEYKDLSVIPSIVDLTYQYISKPDVYTLLKLRGIFKFFSLICKIQYEQILINLVQKCKLKILDVLKVLPELLPIQPKEDNQQQIGLWRKVTEQQLDQNEFLSHIMTIDNRQKVEEFPKSIWFKRYQYSSHGVIKDVDRNAVAQYLANKNNPQSMFYMFLCKVYELQIFNNQLTELIAFVESKYELMPKHLKGKLELYLIMYSIFGKIHQSLKLYPFLKLKQHQLFKLYFDQQKVEKNGFILRKIKPLYEKLLVNGKQIFNQGIYDYFSSSESTVSDLKCILSKLNNQKNQFHISSQKLYEVLINAIMQKIKVGSTCDTPIDQILVYIENIPFPIHNESIMTNLQYIQEINYQSEMLRKIKVDMTLSQIVKKGERVIEMMIDYQIQRHQMQKIKDYRSLRLHAYKILAEIQCRKSNIYGDKFHNYSFKIFLINIMNNIDMIPLCKQLLRDKYLIDQFQIDDAFKQSVVMQLYQWNLSFNKKEEANPYQNHLPFIKNLIDLLPYYNTKRKFIEASMEYAKIFTLPTYKIQYPIFPTFNYYPALVDIELLLQNFAGKQLVMIDMEKVFNLMMELKKLGQAQMAAQFSIDGYEDKLKLQLYEIYLMRLVQERQLKLALTITRSLFNIPNQFPQFNIVYPLLILERTYQEVLQDTANLFNRIISFSFKNPHSLCCLLQDIYSYRFSNRQLNELLQNYLKKTQKELCYDPSNAIFLEWIKDHTDDVGHLNQIFEICLERIMKVNEAHRKSSMQFIFRLMCYQPYAIAKWIWCKGSGINMKTLRSFVSYMSTQDLFNTQAVISSTIDALQIISFKYTNNIFFSEILKFKDHLISQTEQETQTKSNEQEVNHENKPLMLIKQSIRLLKNKRMDIKNKEIELLKQKCYVDLELYLKDPRIYLQKQLSQYIYTDRDDAYEDMNDEISIKSKWRSKVESSKHKKSQQISTNRIYQEIPLPTANRPRKNSEYYPEMANNSINFQPNLKNSSSEKNFSNNFPCQRYPDQNYIPEDDAQQMGSYLQIRVESPLRGDQSPQFLNKLSKTNSLNFSVEDEIENNFEFKISVNRQKNMQAGELVDQLLNTVQGDLGVFDLSRLKTEARKQQFRNYLQQVLHQLYHTKNVNYNKLIRLFSSIIDQYKEKCQLNPQAITIFQKLFQYKGISYINFDFKEALPVKMLFKEDIQEFYDRFQYLFMVGINSIEVFPRIKFVTDVIGNEWKERLIVALVIQKIRHIRQMRSKIGAQLSKQEQIKIIKQLEMEQLKIGVLIDEDLNIINRLTKLSKQLQGSSEYEKRQVGSVLKLSLSVIIDNF